jgi:nucleotide-binding universal stress UspA family protein
MTILNWNSMVHSHRRILHPTDLTERDAFPFEMARSLARGLNAELIVMHAASVKDLNQVPGYRERIEHQLNLIRLSDPELKITTHLFSGDPASQIVGWAEETLCDAIVMRSSQKSWLVGRLTDNVSQRVQKLVRCPVIAIQGRPVYWPLNEQREDEMRSVIELASRTALMVS